MSTLCAIWAIKMEHCFVDSERTEQLEERLADPPDNYRRVKTGEKLASLAEYEDAQVLHRNSLLTMTANLQHTNGNSMGVTYHSISHNAKRLRTCSASYIPETITIQDAEGSTLTAMIQNEVDIVQGENDEFDDAAALLIRDVHECSGAIYNNQNTVSSNMLQMVTNTHHENIDGNTLIDKEEDAVMNQSDNSEQMSYDSSLIDALEVIENESNSSMSSYSISSQATTDSGLSSTLLPLSPDTFEVESSEELMSPDFSSDEGFCCTSTPTKRLLSHNSSTDSEFKLLDVEDSRQLSLPFQMFNNNKETISVDEALVELELLSDFPPKVETSVQKQPQIQMQAAETISAKKQPACRLQSAQQMQPEQHAQQCLQRVKRSLSSAEDSPEIVRLLKKERTLPVSKSVPNSPGTTPTREMFHHIQYMKNDIANLCHSASDQRPAAAATGCSADVQQSKLRSLLIKKVAETAAPSVEAATIAIQQKEKKKISLSAYRSRKQTDSTMKSTSSCDSSTVYTPEDTFEMHAQRAIDKGSLKRKVSLVQEMFTKKKQKTRMPSSPLHIKALNAEVDKNRSQDDIVTLDHSYSQDRNREHVATNEDVNWRNKPQPGRVQQIHTNYLERSNSQLNKDLIWRNKPQPHRVQQRPTNYQNENVFNYHAQTRGKKESLHHDVKQKQSFCEISNYLNQSWSSNSSQEVPMPETLKHSPECPLTTSVNSEININQCTLPQQPIPYTDNNVSPDFSVAGNIMLKTLLLNPKLQEENVFQAERDRAVWKERMNIQTQDEFSTSRELFKMENGNKRKRVHTPDELELVKMEDASDINQVEL